MTEPVYITWQISSQWNTRTDFKTEAFPFTPSIALKGPRLALIVYFQNKLKHPKNTHFAATSLRLRKSFSTGFPSKEPSLSKTEEKELHVQSEGKNLQFKSKYKVQPFWSRIISMRWVIGRDWGFLFAAENQTFFLLYKKKASRKTTGFLL